MMSPPQMWQRSYSGYSGFTFTQREVEVCCPDIIHRNIINTAHRLLPLRPLDIMLLFTWRFTASIEKNDGLWTPSLFIRLEIAAHLKKRVWLYISQDHISIIQTSPRYWQPCWPCPEPETEGNKLCFFHFKHSCDVVIQGGFLKDTRAEGMASDGHGVRSL